MIESVEMFFYASFDRASAVNNKNESDLNEKIQKNRKIPNADQDRKALYLERVTMELIEEIIFPLVNSRNYPPIEKYNSEIETRIMKTSNIILLHIEDGD
ncbi:12185_t:CDS:2 [Acaulospora colombiana]|uniref:12185_t:CDS:1 n=1 Tax=Acaulospora colombiana TaxID=27376 RepID=A0ACA9K387_9GLOM|nr:12185_t:CDS:2 [Acaulospora colombiana]